MDPVRVENPSFDGLAVEVGYENANPCGSDALEIGPDGAVMARQFMEERAPEGYSFHLNLAFANSSPGPHAVPVRIAWAEKDYDFCRDYMYVGYDSGRAWRMLCTREDLNLRPLDPQSEGEKAEGMRLQHVTALRDPVLGPCLATIRRLSPELAEVVSAWQDLPTPIKTGILAMVEAIGGRHSAL